MITCHKREAFGKHLHTYDDEYVLSDWFYGRGEGVPLIASGISISGFFHLACNVGVLKGSQAASSVGCQIFYGALLAFSSFRYSADRACKQSVSHDTDLVFRHPYPVILD